MSRAARSGPARGDRTVAHPDLPTGPLFFPVAAPGTVKRRDWEYTSLLGIAVPLPYGLTFGLDWQRIWDNSNLDIFSYTRNVVSATLTWTY